MIPFETVTPSWHDVDGLAIPLEVATTPRPVGNIMSNLCPRRAARLEALARALDEAAEIDGRERPPFAVGVAFDERGGELHLHDLLDGDPASEMLGFDAPPEWNAFGVVTRGRARSIDPASPVLRASADDTGACVRIVYLVDRCGVEASVVRSGDTPPMCMSSDHSPALGRLVDACRRALGLPTPPPDRDPCELWALLWLDRMVAHVLHDPGSNLTWATAVEMHPAAELARRDSHLAPMVPDRLIELGAALAAVTPWARLRQRCAAGTWPVEGTAAEHASWMDDGMFSRWALDAFPLVGDLIEPLDSLLPPPTTCLVLDALDAWGLT